MRPIVNLTCLIAAFSVCCCAASQMSSARLSDLPVSGQHCILEALSQDIPWLQLAELAASGGIYADQLGFTVAIDGNTVVVGAPGFNQAEGIAYVFVKPAAGWENMTQKAKLTASDGGPDNKFGFSVAISGDTVLVGTCCNQSGGYIFVKPKKGWKNATETVELPIPVGTCIGALSGDTAVCGFLQDNRGGHSLCIRQTEERMAINHYLRRRVGRIGWQSIPRLRGLDRRRGCGGGAYETNDETGAAYLFVKPKGGWQIKSNSRRIVSRTAKLTNSDSAQGDQFGLSVSISGDTVAVGAPYAEAAYVFVKPARGWTNMTQAAKLTANTTDNTSLLGWSVAVAGDTLVAGNPQGDDADNHQGEVFVYLKPAAGWTTTNMPNDRLTASDGQGFDEFGSSVAMSGQTILVGTTHFGIIFGHWGRRPEAARPFPALHRDAPPFSASFAERAAASLSSRPIPFSCVARL
jgi:hypothetical protein